jgi:acetyl esterase/lipase
MNSIYYRRRAGGKGAIQLALRIVILLSFSPFMACSPSGETESTGRAAGESPQKNSNAHVNMDGQTVTYAHRPNQDLNLGIIKPKPENSHHRGILLIHGGGWKSGSRQEMDEIAHFLAEKGFLTATADYRLAPHDLWPAQLDDVQAAVRYLRSHAKELDIDSHKIGAAGISAGGHLSLFLGAVDTRTEGEYPGVSSRVQAVGSISGLHDLNLPLTSIGERYHIVQFLIGERGEIDHKARAAASPLTFVDSKTAPTMFIQGLEDPLVPPDQTAHAEAALKKLGVNTNVQLVEGMKHGMSPSAPLEAKALNQLAYWMYKYLK